MQVSDLLGVLSEARLSVIRLTLHMHLQDTSTGQIVAQHRTKLGPCNVMRQNPWNAVLALGHGNGCVTHWTPNMATPAVKMLCHRVRGFNILGLLVRVADDALLLSDSCAMPAVCSCLFAVSFCLAVTHATAHCVLSSVIKLTLILQGPIKAIAIDPTGHHMVTAGFDSMVKVWDVRTFKPMHAYRSPAPPAWLDISQRGMLAVGHGRRVQVCACSDASLQTFQAALRTLLEWLAAAVSHTLAYMSYGYEAYAS